MKFKEITYRNFGPFKDVSFRLDDIGLVLVQGQNDLSSSADSNGSGKSFTIEGIPYGLFGQTMRGIKGDDVVNKAANKNCEVRICIDNDGQDITVIRYRKMKAGGLKLPDGSSGPTGSGLLLFVDGNDMTRGTIKETDRMIQELIGLDFQTFVRSVYFDANSVQAFPTLSDKEIKDIFEKVLGLEDLAKVLEVVKRRATEQKSKMTSKSSELAMKNAEIGNFDVEILNAQDRAANFEADKRNQVSAKHAQIADIKSKAGDPSALNAELTAANQGVSDIDMKLKDFDPLDGLIDGNNGEIQEMNSKIATHNQMRSEAAMRLSAIDSQTPEGKQQELLTYQTTLSVAKQALDDANKTALNANTKIGSPCGECGKVYEESDLDHIIKHAEGVAAQNSKLYDETLSQVNLTMGHVEEWRQAQRDAINKEIASIDETIASLGEHLKELQLRANNFAKLTTVKNGLLNDRTAALGSVNAVTAKIAAYESVKASIEALEADINRIEASNNPYLEDEKRWRDKKAQAKTESAEIVAKMDEIEGHLDELAVLEKAYGRAGLKAHILETVTPVLNERANDYATALADGAVQIEFSTFKTNKDGSKSERFAVNVMNLQGAEGYLGNSSGERKKIDLSIAMAMSDVVAARASKPVDLWCADEIAESLDQTALERVVGLLHKKASERGTLLTISHTDMTPYIPNVMTVKKTKEGSVLT